MKRRYVLFAELGAFDVEISSIFLFLSIVFPRTIDINRNLSHQTKFYGTMNQINTFSCVFHQCIGIRLLYYHFALPDIVGGRKQKNNKNK